MKLKCIIICAAWLFFSIPALGAPPESAEDTDTIDYSGVQSAIDEMSESDNLNFSDIVKQFFSGNADISFKSVISCIFRKIFDEIYTNKNVMLQVMGISIIGAIFTNFSAAFAKKYVADTGFYLTYMIMFSLLAASFTAASVIAADVVSHLIELMKALVPAFCLALTFASGITTSGTYYQLLMMVVVVVDWVMARFIMNLIRVYVILSLVNCMSKEDYLSKMAGLLELAASWSLKTILGVTLGLNLIQGMVLPAFDAVKNGVLNKAATIIPGLGDAFSTAAKAAIGSGVLLKNAVGTAGLIVICVVCALPLIKLLAIVLMYKLTEAVIQPVSDPRLTECIRITGNGIMLLLKACATVILLFILSIAMITTVSNTALSV